MGELFAQNCPVSAETSRNAIGQRILELLTALRGVVVVLATAANAQTADLSLRLPAALSRFPPYPDVAGTAGASVGSPYASSINPAALAWESVADLYYSASLQSTNIRFTQGMDVRVSGFSASLQTDAWGVLQPTVLDIRSNGSTNQDFLQLAGTFWQLRWSSDSTIAH